MSHQFVTDCHASRHSFKPGWGKKFGELREFAQKKWNCLNCQSPIVGTVWQRSNQYTCGTFRFDSRHLS